MYSSLRTTRWSSFLTWLLVLPFAFTHHLESAPLATRAGVQTFSMDLPNAGPYDPAAMVVVRYRYSCSSLTTGCGNLAITTIVPTSLEYISISTPPGTTAAYSSGTRTLTISRSPYSDGNSGDVLVTFRIAPTASGSSITVPGTSVITDPTLPANASISTSVSFTISTTPPTPKYSVSKSKVAPTSTPAVGTNVTYRLSLSADQINGNVDTAPLTIVDTYPAGATVVNAAGGTVDPVAHTITWTFPTTYLLDSWGRAYSPLTSSFPLSFAFNSYNGDYLEITLNYPSGTFNTSSNITNQVCFTGTSLNKCANVSHGFAAPDPQLVPRKQAVNAEVIAGNQAVYRFGFGALDGNAPVTDPVVIEAIPAGFDLAKFQRAGWNFPDTNVRGRIEYSTNNQGSWTILEDHVAPTGISDYRTFNRGTDFPTGVTHIRWTLYDDGDIALPNQIPREFQTREYNYGNSNVVYLDVPAGTAVGSSIQNCVTASGSNMSNKQACATITVANPTPTIHTYKNQHPAVATSIKPGDEVEWAIRLQNSGQATGNATNPTIMDLLPPQLEFVRWSRYDPVNSGLPSPNLEVLNNYNGTGRTLLRWTWSNTAPAGSYDISGAPGVSNPGSLGFPDLYNNVYVVTRVKPGTPVGVYENKSLITASDATIKCTSNTYSATDTNDLDGDGNTTERFCQNVSTASINVVSAVVMGAEKWILGHASLPNVD
ncbi:MAG TPA: hypothetical protein PLL64_03365, partial [Rhodothermales bacterium]|nr:hypothetical protein [Rhodothermales bacterium]